MTLESDHPGGSSGGVDDVPAPNQSLDSHSLAEFFDQPLDLPVASTKSLPASGGVCLFCDAEDHAILLAAGEDLRRLVGRRIAQPLESSRRLELGAVAARVYWRNQVYAPKTRLHGTTIGSGGPRNYRPLVNN